MLKIRLTRVGKSHTPIYRLVVAEKTRAVKREYLEVLGLYNPANKDDRFQVKKDRVLYWIGQGAQPSDTARNLLCDFDVLPKKDKINIVHGKATKKKTEKQEVGGVKQEEKAESAEEVSTDETPAENVSEEVVTEENPTEDVDVKPAESEVSEEVPVEEKPKEEKSE